MNALLPGPTHTETPDKLRAERAKATGKTRPRSGRFLLNFRPTSLIRRFTSADEVAALGVYLCSEAASGTSARAMRSMAAWSIIFSEGALWCASWQRHP